MVQIATAGAIPCQGTRLTRTNSWLEIQGLPSEACPLLERHLAVPVEQPKPDSFRFGSYFQAEDQWWGSFLQPWGVPSGFAPHVVAILNHYGYRFEYKDRRQRPVDPYPWWSLDVEPRPYQNLVQRALARTDGIGVVVAPPRAGKTLMAIRAMDTWSAPGVYVAPSIAIVKQTYERLCYAFGSDCVARLDSEASPFERDPSKHFVVTTPPTALSLPQEWWDTRELLIVDEYHRAAAESYFKINVLARNAYHRIGLTGTYFRSGSDALALQALCSGLVHEIKVQDLVREGWLAQPRVKVISVPGQVRASDHVKAHEIGIAHHAPRNEKIVAMAQALANMGQPTIVIVNRRKHAFELSQEIEGSVAVRGGDGDLVDSRLDDFRQGRVQVLVGTSVLGEGVDLPNASVLIYAAGGSASVSVAQAYFRPLTKHEGKDVATIYDFADQHNKMLGRQSQRRLTMMREILGDCIEVL